MLLLTLLEAEHNETVDLNSVVNLKQMCYSPVDYNQKNSHWHKGTGKETTPLRMV